MDRHQFDALTRGLASIGPRRAALGALLGAGLILGGTPATSGKRRKRKKRCRKLLDRCTPGKAPRCCAGTVCGTSQISGSRCCIQRDRACDFSPSQDECCPGFACSEAAGVCEPLS